MNTQTVHQLIHTIAELSHQKVSHRPKEDSYLQNRTYTADDIPKFIDELILNGQKSGFTCLHNSIQRDAMPELLDNLTFPVIFFHLRPNGQAEPLLVYRDDRDVLTGRWMDSDALLSAKQIEMHIPDLCTQQNGLDPAKNGEIVFVTSFPVQYMALRSESDAHPDTAPPTPMRRLMGLLSSERKDITYIYIYAIIVGLISLILPLGIQSMIRLISGGMIFSSVVVIISVVIVGLLASGGLQIMQISLVEILQQRIFARAAFEFAYRLPKIRLDALRKYYPPELMNRFFDVVTIQKALPKLLVDMTGAVLQVVFSLLLLSFYHPLFLGFSIVLVIIITLVIYLTGPKGLQTSLSESKYKYKIVYWLEEIARTVNSFRLAGNTNLHMQKMDEYASNYLYYRKSHFSVLRSQMVFVVLFKTLVIGGLLILGSLLVVNRQITLGQFVASEIVIVLVVGAVEKILINMETIYDLLTAVEKIGAITDLPLEKERGSHVELEKYPNGLLVTTSKLSYTYSGGQTALKNLTFTLQPGEKIGIAGFHHAGKHTLAKLLAGVMNEYTGGMSFNGISVRDIHPNYLRTVVNSYLFEDSLFEGTLLDNIAMSRNGITYEDVCWAMEKVGLNDFLHSLPDGMYTNIAQEKYKPSNSIAHKILFARAIVSKPKLLVIQDALPEMYRNDRIRLIDCLTSREMNWTLVTISNDPAILAKCDRILILSEGGLIAEGTYTQLEKHPVMREAAFQE